ncbi:hypothetical protein [Legionella brunensis]|uniref:Uncharacterized protein n=1 Tax=Legionella brunensis TaxID=29422 RepID=A0A0W0SUZ9_9GAMM|nr:hypothetical protein [Legionella brunensis]KTC87021.1 hypothetical protein Lbru_0250 [Legionella brunensis]
MLNRANFDDFNISEAEAKKFIQLGIKGELQFEVMNNQQSHYQVLNERQLNEILSNHPEKKEVRLTDGHYNPQRHNFDSFSYEQRINYENMWFDAVKFKAILGKYPHYLKNGVAPTQEDKLQTSPYFREFTKRASKAIQEYPEWKKNQRKIQVTGNFMEWLNERSANTREADVIKKILSDFYKELN